MGLVFFLAVVQLGITLVHWIIWRTFDYFWPLVGPARESVFWVFVALSLSFLSCNILARFFPNRATRGLYLFATMWLGTTHFLFLTSVLLSLLVSFSVSFNRAFPASVALVFYVGALILNLYTLWRGTRVEKRILSLTLPHLPETWVGKKIAFFADTHFGNIHREFMARQVVEILKAEDPDLILMGGDFFDGPPLEADRVTAPFRSLAERIPTYFISGNHEEYGNTKEFLRSLEQSGFRIINDKVVILEGLQIVGLNFLTTRTREATDLVLHHLALDTSLSTIALKHVPRHIGVLAKHGVHLTLHGHTHRGQMWPFNLVTTWLYHGYDYGLQQYHKTLVYTTSGAGSWGPPQRFGTTQEIVFFLLEKEG